MSKLKIIDVLKALKEEKQIRILYEDNGECDWNEEVWLYNENTGLCECYYPNSTFPIGYCTYHTVDYARDNFEDSIDDCNEKGKVKEIIIENGNISENHETLKEKAIKIIEKMSDDELRIFLLKG